jgi:hypothetical protein
MVLDGEIAVPDDQGVTHIDLLNDAIAARRPGRLAFFAFDLLHLDGHDLRRCAIEERKAVVRRVIDDASCERIVYLDHVIGGGQQLFEKVRAIGGEGIVSKRLGRPYRGGQCRDWLKTKVFESGRFLITGYQEPFSNVIAIAIMTTTAATLNAYGVTNVESSAQAAEALKPIAGSFAYLIFTVGIIGTGVLAVPVLAGSAAYAIAEGMRWPVGLARQPREAWAFYCILGIATVIGIGLNFTLIDLSVVRVF